MDKMISMISMKRTAAEKKMDKGVAAPSPTEDYPWGLRLDWDDGVLKKLGMDEMPDMGEEMHLTCKVKVVACSESTNEKNKSHSLSLQITDLMLDGGFESGFKG